VIAVDGLMSGDLGIAEAIRLLLGGEQLDILAQRALVALEGENVIGILVADFLGDVALAADGVGGNDGAPRCLGSGKSLKHLKKQSLRCTPQTSQPPPSRPPQIESGRITTDSALQPFVTR
jgi:hypothetical protein